MPSPISTDELTTLFFLSNLTHAFFILFLLGPGYLLCCRCPHLFMFSTCLTPLTPSLWHSNMPLSCLQPYFQETIPWSIWPLCLVSSLFCFQTRVYCMFPLLPLYSSGALFEIWLLCPILNWNWFLTDINNDILAFKRKVFHTSSPFLTSLLHSTHMIALTQLPLFLKSPWFCRPMVLFILV